MRRVVFCDQQVAKQQEQRVSVGSRRIAQPEHPVRDRKDAALKTASKQKAKTAPAAHVSAQNLRAFGRTEAPRGRKPKGVVEQAIVGPASPNCPQGRRCRSRRVMRCEEDPPPPKKASMIGYERTAIAPANVDAGETALARAGIIPEGRSPKAVISSFRNCVRQELGLRGRASDSKPEEVGSTPAAPAGHNNPHNVRNDFLTRL